MCGNVRNLHNYVARLEQDMRYAKNNGLENLVR